MSEKLTDVVPAVRGTFVRKNHAGEPTTPNFPLGPLVV
jgi:hypothetical protein